MIQTLLISGAVSGLMIALATNSRWMFVAALVFGVVAGFRALGGANTGSGA